MKDLLKQVIDYFNFVNQHLHNERAEDDARSTRISVTGLNFNNTNTHASTNDKNPTKVTGHEKLEKSLLE